MKLSHEQVDLIARYLETKGLFQFDIKYEVLDHMTLSIENAMSTRSMKFADAFNEEQIKWKEELGPFQSWWLGDRIKGPKIVLVSYIRSIKRMYLKTLFTSLAVFTVAYLFLKALSFDQASFLPLVGVIYLFILVSMLVAYFGMNRQGVKTTSASLFRYTMGYYGIWLLVFNPVFTKLYWIYQNDQFIATFLFIHIFLLCFSFNFIGLFMGHAKVLKIHRKL